MANSVSIRTTAPGAKEAATDLNSVKDKLTGLQAAGKQGFAIGAGAAVTTKALDLMSGAIHKGTEFVFDSIGAASDLNETMSKSAVIFGDNETAVEGWASTAATAMGQSKQQAIDTASGFAGLFQTVGIGKDQVVGFSEGMTQMGSDLASFFNTDVQTALDALKSGLNGESEPLRKFNVFLSDSAVQAELAKEGIKKVNGQFTEGQKVTARYKIIMQQTGAAQGDFGRTSDGLANSQRTLNADMEDMKATLGQALLPVMKDLAGAAKDVLGWFNNLDPQTQQLIAGIGALAVAGTPAILVLGKMVSAGKDVVGAVGTLVSKLVGSGGATAAVDAFGNSADGAAGKFGNFGKTLGAAGLGAGIALAFDQANVQLSGQIDRMSSDDAKLWNDSWQKNVFDVGTQAIVANHLEDMLGPGFRSVLESLAGLGGKAAGDAFEHDSRPAFQAAAESDADTWAETIRLRMSETEDDLAATAAATADAQAKAYSSEVERNKNSLSLWGLVRDKQISDAAAAKELFDKSARAITGDLVGTLKGAKDDVGNAMKDLLWAMNHPLVMQKRITQIQADLNSQALADGLSSQYQWIQDAAKQAQQKWLDEWKQLDPKGYAAAHAASESVADGLNDGYTKAVADAKAMANQVNAWLRSIDNNVHVDVNVDSHGFGPSAHGHRAGGGPAPKGVPLVVGDGGRSELFVPNEDGVILPSVPTALSGSGQGVHVHVHLEGDAAGLFRVIDREQGRQLALAPSSAYSRG